VQQEEVTAIFKKIVNQKYFPLYRILLSSLIISSVFFFPFIFFVMSSKIDEDTTSEIIQTETMASEIKNVLEFNKDHHQEIESNRLGEITTGYSTFTNDKFTVYIEDGNVLFKKESRVSSYITFDLVEKLANLVADNQKSKYESGWLTSTQVVINEENGHRIFKSTYHLDHGEHRDKVVIERDLTELYAKTIRNGIFHGLMTFVFLYVAIVAISYLLQIWQLRLFKKVVNEQQAVIAAGGNKQYTNIGKNYNKYLKEVSDIIIKQHTRANEMYITNKNLLQDISHETSSRLTEIKQSVDLIRYYGAEDKEQVEELLERISMAALNISSTHNTFIDLAKVENHESIGSISCYNAQELINFAISQASHQYPKIDFIQHNSEKQKFLCLRREHFLLIMRTLLENAVKYSSVSNRVLVEILDGPAYHGCVAVKVTNWGTYIPEDERERIFERYYRGTNARQNKSGVGLGLHIVKKVIELYESKIEIESDISGETSFVIIFPEAKNEDEIAG